MVQTVPKGSVARMGIERYNICDSSWSTLKAAEWKHPVFILPHSATRLMVQQSLLNAMNQSLALSVILDQPSTIRFKEGSDDVDLGAIDLSKTLRKLLTGILYGSLPIILRFLSQSLEK